MNPFLVFAVAFLARVSPAVLKVVAPILVSTDKDLIKIGYPIAVQVVQDLEKGDLQGLAKHIAAVTQTKAAILATGKVALKQFTDAHIGQIVLAAFFNTLGAQTSAAAVKN
jgi:hypothetical protein